MTCTMTDVSLQFKDELVIKQPNNTMSFQTPTIHRTHNWRRHQGGNVRFAIVDAKETGI